MTDTLLIVIIVSLIADALIGDPNYKLHPVRLLGALADKMESVARRKLLKPGEAPSAARLRVAGFAAWLIVTGCALACAFILSAAARRIGLIPGILADSFIIWASIAPSDLSRHALRVQRALRSDKKNNPDQPVEGQAAVAMIVGRRVETLSFGDVSRAAVESVAESSIDGVAAPLFWACLFGPAAAFAYRAVNTMDSMFGHKNERYFYFGHFPARADDVANYLPARLSSMLACVAAPALGFSLREALASFFKYRLSHASPNAGHPEAAYAGALGISLGGPVRYDEGTVLKPFMNPQGRESVPEDIGKSVRLMYAQTLLSAAAFLACRLAVMEIIKW